MSILRLFASSPFESLQELLEKIDVCVSHIKPMVTANIEADFDEVKNHFRLITKAEHEADVVKGQIRGKLPRTLFLPIDRWHFLEIIASADKIADAAEDLGYLLTVRHTHIPETLTPEFVNLMEKSLASYALVKEVVDGFGMLVDAGFAGPIAEEFVQKTVRIDHLEWETDKQMYKLTQHLFELENQISVIDIIMLRDIAREIARLADASESLGKKIRRVLAN
ncbi:MAG: TIGR00153 family protein [Planctomycetales bacterium]|nr:TIGR00153 family protein [bacterium]UNM07201.1 MAG: TIGR00153 family protein [Planctomycetales bacterium]